MCSSTRFPGANPLRNIKTTAVVKSLIKLIFFTLVELFKSMQSDQSSDFMYGLFLIQQVVYQFGIA